MIRIVFLLVTLALTGTTASAQSAGGAFVLKGKLAGANDSVLYFYHTDKSGKRIKDSAKVADGRFTFKGEISQPVMGSLSVKEPKWNEGNNTSFFLEPGIMTINLKMNDFRNAVVTGSKTQDHYAALARSKKPIDIKYQKQLDSLRTEKDHEKNAEIRERLAPYFSEMDEADYVFFRAHPSSPVTAYMLRYHVSDLSLAELHKYYNGLGAAMQQTSDGKDLAKEIQKLTWGSPGSMAKNFTANDINGNEISVAGYKGKYLILDFWASWCVPCRKGNPHLKELYTLYKDRGLEIIGISDDDRKPDAWKKAVAEDDLPWKHVLRGLKHTGGYPDRSADISENYGIHTLPTKILIDPSGIIIGRYTTEGDEMDRKLAEVFAK